MSAPVTGTRRQLLPRSTPSAAGLSSRAVGRLLDRLEEYGVECHSLMIVHGGHVVAEGWWAPYSADRPHLLYSLTKSFTSMAVGFAVADGLLSLDDRVVDVLPDHVPPDADGLARMITVRHLLSMTTGHDTDTLATAWALEPDDLTKGFLRVPPEAAAGSRHTYDNATTYVLARMVERVTGLWLPELLDTRLFRPMGIDGAEWDRLGSGAVFGFHGLHLRTEAIAAFGELLRCGGVRHGQQIVPRTWVKLATSRHIEGRRQAEGDDGPDFLAGYGYQIWMSRHGFHGKGAFGQHCVVVPEHELVVSVTGAQTEVRHAQDLLDALWECLVPGIGRPDGARDDGALVDRLRGLSLPQVDGELRPEDSVTARLDASPEGSALPCGTEVTAEPNGNGWLLHLGADLRIETGHGTWRESSPLGRPVVASGAWQGAAFIADLYVITSPHRVRLTVDANIGTATATWTTQPLTSLDLRVHLFAPLSTRPDVA